MDVRKLISTLPLLLAACGGDIFVGPDGGGGGSSLCPATPPGVGTQCTPFKAGEKCEYGKNPDPNCNQIFVCTGTWVDQSANSVCPSQSNCPGQFSDVQVGQECSYNTLSCSYPQAECICTQSVGGLVTQTPQWDCFPAQSGCPQPRPDIGTACSTPNQSCNYGACSGGVQLTCTSGGTWQEAVTVCPK